MSALASDPFKPLLRFLIVRKAAFVESKRGGVVVTPAIDQTRRMFNVKHLMIEDVLDKPFGHIDRVQRFTNRYVIVHAVVMSQNAARSSS